MDDRFAKSVIDFASGEATPAPYGCVNDKYPDAREGPGIRFGWRRLKEYFEVAAGFTDNHWRIPGYLDGVRLNNHRVPQPGASGVQWCGIFATFCWIRGGVPGAHWMSPGVGGPDVKKTWGSGGIGIGDIAVIQAGGLMHHFLVSGFEGDGTIVDTINGNSDYQGITRKSLAASTIAAYYTVDDPFYRTLQSQYGQGA